MTMKPSTKIKMKTTVSALALTATAAMLGAAPAWADDEENILEQINNATINAYISMDIDDIEDNSVMTATAAAIGNSLKLEDLGELPLDDDAQFLQENNGDVTAEIIGDYEGEGDAYIDDIDAESEVTLTAAAMGNSVTLDTIEIESDGGDFEQVNNGEINANIEIEVEDIDDDSVLTVTAAAMGNTAKLVDGTEIEDGDFDQENNGYAEAHVDLDIEDLYDSVVSVTAAAFGNNASMDNVEFEGEYADFDQENDADVEAYTHVELDDEFEDSVLNLTAVAMGNNLSMDDVHIENDAEFDQENDGDIYAEVDLEFDDVDYFENSEIVLTAAAMGNSAKGVDILIEADEPPVDQSQVAEFAQENDGDIEAEIYLDVYTYDEESYDVSITATAAAYGNSLSIEGINFQDGIEFEQENDGEIAAEVEVDMDDMDDDNVGMEITLTAAAFGNSLKIDNLTYSFGDSDTSFEQDNSGDVEAKIELINDEDFEDGSSITLTAAAFGNSASLTGFSGGVGSNLTFQQYNSGDIEAGIEQVDLYDMDDGTITITAAAMGNTLSISNILD